jgi:FkbH-like protein
MKLIEALEIMHQERPASAARRTVFLGCGFTPLHLQTFLNAHLQRLSPQAAVEVEVGWFGDLAGNLQRARAGSWDAVAVVLEWPDLDPRLGFRRLGGWAPRLLSDILASARAARQRMQEELKCLAHRSPVVLSLPTLPPAPAGFTAGWQASTWELELRSEVSALAAWAAGQPCIRVLNEQRMDRMSPHSHRRDIQSELRTGFPYTQKHAEILASLLAALMHPPQPRKGLITDLDDTLWRGILGEVGVQGIAWDLDGGCQLHGLYQQLLSALAESGVLIGVASKNEPELVKQAFERRDLHIQRRQIVPFQVHWGPKSQSAGRILEMWNVSAESVVFVDDSPMELAEVKAAHPEIECLLFPKNDPAAAVELLEYLRDLFGKPALHEEDRIRAESLRRPAVTAQPAAASRGTPDELLAQANAEIDIQFSCQPDYGRAFELINKTNQFNLNGRRYTEAEWQRYFDQSGAFRLSVGYRDKFGPLGSISVVLGRVCQRRVHVDSWVMSCRAFSRRIEYQCLRVLFEEFQAEEITLDFRPTARNRPLAEFLSAFGPTHPDFRIDRDSFRRGCPALHHAVFRQNSTFVAA